MTKKALFNWEIDSSRSPWPNSIVRRSVRGDVVCRLIETRDSSGRIMCTTYGKKYGMPDIAELSLSVDYCDTTLDAVKTKIDTALEKIGYKVLPEHYKVVI